MFWKRVTLVLGSTSIAIGVVWVAMRTVSERRSRALLEGAKQDVSAGRIASARRVLAELVAGRPGWDEALYHLGVCEQARNRPSAALEVFERISPASPWSGWSGWTAAGSRNARGY
jgi:hypothetical protein